jgi:hypothetical protein
VAKSKNNEVTMNRRGTDDRRNNGGERRKQTATVAVERRDNERRKAPRRRQIDPTTCERDYTDEEIEFMHALDAYKRASGRMFPTCSEILEVIRDLGYTRSNSATTTPAKTPIAPLVSTTGDFSTPVTA